MKKITRILAIFAGVASLAIAGAAAAGENTAGWENPSDNNELYGLPNVADNRGITWARLNYGPEMYGLPHITQAHGIVPTEAVAESSAPAKAEKSGERS
ncbi:MAG: hypothetical protein HY804_02360 [Nitrospinae bacterium]|nr:hypothetical protein [Nitrospinota bacterium]